MIGLSFIAMYVLMYATSWRAFGGLDEEVAEIAGGERWWTATTA